MSIFSELMTLLPVLIFLFVFSQIKRAGKKRAADMQAADLRPRSAPTASDKDAPRQTGFRIPQSAPAKSGRYTDSLSAAPKSTVRTRPTRQAREVSRAATGQTEKASSIRNMSSMLMEDRKNDWLARQLREENRIKLRGDMLDLGASHDRDCDARSLKREHLLEHDDTIDNGEF